MSDPPSTPAGPPTLQVIVASTRPGRAGRTIGEWVERAARAHGGFDVELVDLAEVGLPFLDEPHHPILGQYVHQHTKDWSATVSRADAFVFVTPEYNHSFNAALKNAIDFLHKEWQHKPVGFVSYGGLAAGTRAVTAFTPVLTVLRMVPVVETVAISHVAKLIDDTGVLQPSERMAASANSMLDELATQTTVLASRR
jgi:NAD(P)H-dependent FMN reductase